jgi:hypothetical protein
MRGRVEFGWSEEPMLKSLTVGASQTA